MKINAGAFLLALAAAGSGAMAFNNSPNLQPHHESPDRTRSGMAPAPNERREAGYGATAASDAAAESIV
ncbi:hypothetical protein HIM_05496 [Hirsutella minnesotensis 3608]|uniref:Uncharacterized protein n=1 Tax=Hirsutella minnesotensis 3608 TaxID=1043627 RepID=A0A0F7ZP75_9HYPO|nr:hypothetical protein HIM_05496 [Hirsutella minnesotensis 3608]